MNKEDINELLEYNNEYMEAQISEEIFGRDYTSAVELKYVKQELDKYKNIVDELEKWLKANDEHFAEALPFRETLRKLKELKGE